MSEEIKLPVSSKPAECLLSASANPAFCEREEHRPQPQEDEVWKAFHVLAKACDLKGESGTDHLFHVLFEACKRVKSRDYKRVVLTSHRDGLNYDVTFLMTDRVLEVMKEMDIVQEWCCPR